MKNDKERKRTLADRIQAISAREKRLAARRRALESRSLHLVRASELRAKIHIGEAFVKAAALTASRDSERAEEMRDRVRALLRGAKEGDIGSALSIFERVIAAEAAKRAPNPSGSAGSPGSDAEGNSSAGTAP